MVYVSRRCCDVGRSDGGVDCWSVWGAPKTRRDPGLLGWAFAAVATEYGVVIFDLLTRCHWGTGKGPGELSNQQVCFYFNLIYFPLKRPS